MKNNGGAGRNCLPGVSTQGLCSGLKGGAKSRGVREGLVMWISMMYEKVWLIT